MARLFLGIREQIKAELRLIGEGPDMTAVKSILQQSGFKKDVRYWGLTREIASILVQTDLLLITSLAESFCLAALEAMACGVPVLATKVSGLPEVAVHGETGFLFPVGDHALAVHLALKLLSNPSRHQNMRKAAAQHARRSGQEQTVPVYEAFYQKLLQRGSFSPERRDFRNLGNFGSLASANGRLRGTGHPEMGLFQNANTHGFAELP